MAPTEQRFDLESNDGTRHTVRRIPAATDAQGYGPQSAPVEVPGKARLITDQGLVVRQQGDGTYRVGDAPTVYRRVPGSDRTGDIDDD